MKKYSMTITLLFLLLSGAAFAQEKAAKTEDEKAIRANVEQMVKGWNMKSGAEFAKPFAEDSDYVIINGMHIKGRATNAAGHQQIFDTIYKDQDIGATVEKIRFLRPDVAVVHVLVERFPKSDRSKIFKARITMVMVKNGGKWEIEAFQNTQIQTENP
ncbi:MAG TPA: SgcJ/EcaC family oxidoreductase [Pyrinomonadaceae bacterium]|nr:SgcJ/EcaC family oxidoreductase [Pyrinomonadaceae bacterium]